MVREIAVHRLQAPGLVEGRELGVLRELLQHVIGQFYWMVNRESK